MGGLENYPSRGDPDMFLEANKEDLVPYIQENIIRMSQPEDKMHVNVIPDEVEIVRPNEISEMSSEMSSELTYHKKDAYTDMSVYNRVLNAL